MSLFDLWKKKALRKQRWDEERVPCSHCGGTGVGHSRDYHQASGWDSRGSDMCYSCMGSGREFQVSPWWRQQREEIRARWVEKYRRESA
jgi:hypothetical protein